MSAFLVLAGPTASGKTEVASQLCRILPVEIISCDSMQVYKGMPIVTQTPPKRFFGSARTHLVSFLDPSEEYSAALFRKDAVDCLQKIFEKKKTPLIVGGTGLYYRALLDGLFEAEGAGAGKDEALRKRLLEEEKEGGPGSLHRRLEKVDPVSAGKIHHHDLRRTIRALEVFTLTGRRFSELRPQRSGIRGRWPHRTFFLELNRRDLYDRINRRVEKMFADGLTKEIQTLLKKKLSQTAGLALGVREVRAYLEGKLTLSEAKEFLKKNTRNYAKRQLSWFRHERDIEPVTVRPNESAREVAQRISALL